MQAEITFAGKSAFEAKIRDHKFMMDTQVAAGGDNRGPSPKEFMLASMIGCTEWMSLQSSKSTK
jgi:putative redox protein